MANLSIPLSVPKRQHNNYLNNFRLATQGSGRLFLFAGDQKVEHLNDDFYGVGIDPSDAEPEHLFKIASQIPGAVLAVHIGLLARYGQDYKQLPFILKVNGKSSLSDKKDALFSGAWLSSGEITRFKQQNNLKIVALGYTIYLGSEHEARMLAEAAMMIQTAHQEGMLAIIWMYPRSSKIKDEDDPHIIAGGAGVAACLGADFVKVKYPYKTATTDKKAEVFTEVVKAAGRTKVICVGGGKQKAEDLIRHLARQVKNGSAGMAVGRNIHQRSLTEAVNLGKAITAILHKNANLKEALDILKGKKINKNKTQKKSKILGLF